jgi:hypothetical protein
MQVKEELIDEVAIEKKISEIFKNEIEPNDEKGVFETIELEMQRRQRDFIETQIEVNED